MTKIDPEEIKSVTEATKEGKLRIRSIKEFLLLPSVKNWIKELANSDFTKMVMRNHNKKTK
jgi:hypothetical protein